MAAEQKHDLWQPMGDYFYKLRQLTRYHEHFNNQKHILQIKYMLLNMVLFR